MQFCGLDRLLQHRRVSKCGNDGVGTVAGDEGEGNFPVRQYVSYRVSFLATQIHVEDSCVQIIAFGRKHRVAESTVGAVDFMSEGGQHVRQHHRYQWLVFDEENALVIGIRCNGLRRNAVNLTRFEWTLRVHMAIVRNGQSAMQAIRLPVKIYKATELTLDACDDGAAAVAPARGRRNLRSA